MSDLHLEFDVLKDAQSPDADVAILAGDIWTGTKAIDWIKDQFTIPVIYIAGNHEFYHTTRSVTLEKLKEKAKGTNIHFLEKEHVEIDGVTFFGATLWTDFELYGTPEYSMREACTCMNDYFLIKEDEVFSFGPRMALAEHKETLKALRELKETKNPEKLVVVTHHGPTRKSIHEDHLGSNLNPAYASNLEDVIKEISPQYWVHGHVHDSKKYWHQNTEVVMNCRGYYHFNYGYPQVNEFNVYEYFEI